MNYQYIKICFFLFIISFTSYSQFNNLASIDFTYIPQKNSNIEYSRLKISANYPIKLKKEGAYIFTGLSFSDISLSFEKEPFTFNQRKLNDFKLIDLSISYTQKIKNDWRIAFRFKPGVSTNSNTASALSRNDVVLSFDAIFIKTRQINDIKKDRLIWGVTYAQNRGFSYPLPFISYYKKLDNKWSYNVGIPKTNIQYHYSKKHRFKLYGELDGFTSNLQENIILEGEQTVNRINLSLIVGGFQYEYHIINHLEFFARTAYNFSIKTTLRNNNDTIFTIDDSSRLYLRTGLRFKI